MTENVLAHRILEVMVSHLGLSQVVGLVASTANIMADRVEGQGDPEIGDLEDQARQWRQDGQTI